MYIIPLGVLHSRYRQRKLQAGTGEKSLLIAIMQHHRDIRSRFSNPVEPCPMHKFTRKWHQRTLLKWTQLQEDGVELGRGGRGRYYIHEYDSFLFGYYQ